MAAACGGLHQIFYSAPQPESPASSFMIDSSPWKNPNPNPNQPLDHSFTEIFGELHFQEPSPIFNISSSSSSSSFSWSSPSSSSSSPPPPPEAADSINDPAEAKERNNEDPASGSSLFLGRRHRNSDSFSSMNTESRLLQMCTEGLGFESFDDVEDLKSEILSCGSNWDDKYCNLMDSSSSSSSSSTPHAWARDQSVAVTGGGGGGDTVLDTGLDQYKRAKRRCAREFPPPISCIGRSTGKPCVWFESYRKDGRFVLRQVRIPAQQFLHARRENGRLRLCFVQPGGDQAHELDDDDDDDEDEDDQGGDLENAAKNQEDIEDDEVNSTEVYI
ncbi:hypothetical protein Dimus_009365 [Dionaea muscipula]